MVKFEPLTTRKRNQLTGPHEHHRRRKKTHPRLANARGDQANAEGLGAVGGAQI